MIQQHIHFVSTKAGVREFTQSAYRKWVLTRPSILNIVGDRSAAVTIHQWQQPLDCLDPKSQG